MTAAHTSGIHHLGLTVADLEQTKRFFIEALGFRLVGEKPSYPAAFVSDGSVMLTLWQAQTPTPTPFDRKAHLGLHHFALAIHPERSLDELYQELKKRDDVEIEFAPTPVGAGPNRHMMCAIPGGLRMEIVAPAAS